MSIFDANGNKKLECPLPFQLRRNFWPALSVSMAKTKHRKIAILDRNIEMVYIGNVCVELNAYEVEKSFHVEDHVEKIRFSNFNGIKMIALGWRTIYIYTENGELEREIEIPREFGNGQSLAIHHITQRILITTLLYEKSFATMFRYLSLLQFSESGELLDSLCLSSCDWLSDYGNLTSHFNDSVVLVGERKAAYLELQQNHSK